MSIASRRRYLAWSLLLVMAFVLVPRSSLHRCDRVSGHHAHTGGASITSDCAICDVALPISTEAEQWSQPLLVGVIVPLPSCQAMDPQLGHVLHASDRGPPPLA